MSPWGPPAAGLAVHPYTGGSPPLPPAPPEVTARVEALEAQGRLLRQEEQQRCCALACEARGWQAEAEALRLELRKLRSEHKALLGAEAASRGLHEAHALELRRVREEAEQRQRGRHAAQEQRGREAGETRLRALDAELQQARHEQLRLREQLEAERRARAAAEGTHKVWLEDVHLQQRQLQSDLEVEQRAREAADQAADWERSQLGELLAAREEERARWEARHGSAGEEVLQLGAECQRLQAAEEEAARARGRAEQAEQHLEAEAARLRGDLRALRAARDEEQRAREASSQSRQCLEAEAAGLRADRCGLQDEVERLCAERRGLQAALAAAESVRWEAEERLSAADREAEEESLRLQGSVAALREAEQRARREAEEKRREAESESLRLQSSAAALQEELVRLRIAASSPRALGASLEDHQPRAAAAASVASPAEPRAAAPTGASPADRQREALVAKCEALRDGLCELRAAKEEARVGRAEAERRLGQLEESLDQERGRASRLRAELEASARQDRRGADEAAQLRAQLAAVAAERDAMERSLQQERGITERLQGELRAVRATRGPAADGAGHLAELERELERERSARRLLQQEISSLWAASDRGEEVGDAPAPRLGASWSDAISRSEPLAREPSAAAGPGSAHFDVAALKRKLEFELSAEGDLDWFAAAGRDGYLSLDIDLAEG